MLKEHDLFRGEIDKVAIAIKRIISFEPDNGYYVAFSGGKDSIVIKDLVLRSGVKAEFHQNLTTVDPPELLMYVRQHHKDVIFHRPEKSMWKLIVEKMMPPTRIVRYCCEKLKEGGGKGRVVVTGVRWAESYKRSKRRMVETCYRDNSKTYVNPIIDWSDAEVWEYINVNKLPYCSLYDEGFTRVGCVGCPMAGKNRLKEFARWPGFEKSYRRAFAAAAANRLERGNKYGIGDNHKLRWEDGDAMFDWWMADRFDITHPDQGVLFE